MQIGKIVGCVVATAKNPGLAAQRLLIVQPLTPELNVTGKTLICTDSTGAGAGELVYWCKGKEASFPFLPAQVPTDATVVGIVDKITVRRGHKNECS
jgi:ethanolamine utilization protein EutN